MLHERRLLRVCKRVLRDRGNSLDFARALRNRILKSRPIMLIIVGGEGPLRNNYLVG